MQAITVSHLNDLRSDASYELTVNIYHINLINRSQCLIISIGFFVFQIYQINQVESLPHCVTMCTSLCMSQSSQGILPLISSPCEWIDNEENHVAGKKITRKTRHEIKLRENLITAINITSLPNWNLIQITFFPVISFDLFHRWSAGKFPHRDQF